MDRKGAQCLECVQLLLMRRGGEWPRSLVGLVT